MGFILFPPDETDTVIVRRFAKSSNFATLVDSFQVDSVRANYSRTAGNLLIDYSYGGDGGLLSKYDYQIWLPASNKTYEITEMAEEVKSQKSGGIFAMDKQPCSNLITSYKLNGQLVSGKTAYGVIYMQQ
jgi:hypothetical protein